MNRRLALMLLAAVLSVHLAAEGKRYAVLVGINDYMDPGIVDLTTPRNDAGALAALLRGWDRVFLMTDDVDLRGPDAPTSTNIENRLNLLAELTGPDDFILVFFSGHGVSTPQGDSRILPLDGNLSRMEATSLSLAAMDKALNAKGKRKVLYLIDACRESISTAKGLKVVGMGAESKSGVNALYATQTGWYSYEDSDKRYGVFTKFLLSGLAGAADGDQNGSISVAELGAWIPGAVSDQALSSGIRQKPVSSLPDGAVARTILQTSARSAPRDTLPPGTAGPTPAGPLSAAEIKKMPRSQRLRLSRDNLAKIAPAIEAGDYQNIGALLTSAALLDEDLKNDRTSQEAVLLPLLESIKSLVWARKLDPLDGLDIADQMYAAFPETITVNRLYAFLYQDKGRAEKALGYINEAIRIGPQDAIAHNDRSYLLLQLNRDLDLAWADIQYQLKEPTDYFAARHAAALSLAMSKPQQALQWSEEALTRATMVNAISADPFWKEFGYAQVLTLKAKALLELGRVKEARETLQVALKQQGADEARNLLANNPRLN